MKCVTCEQEIISTVIGWRSAAMPHGGFCQTPKLQGKYVFHKPAESQPLASEVAPGESEYSLDDYMNAPSGIGPLAPEWEDKPHRLVYDLVKRLKMAEPQGAEAPWPLNMFCEAHADTTLGDANVSDPCPLCAADKELEALREQLEQAKLDPSQQYIVDEAAKDGASLGEILCNYSYCTKQLDKWKVSKFSHDGERLSLYGRMMELHEPESVAAPRPQEPRNFSDFDCGGCGDGGCIQCCPSNFTEKALIEEMDELREAVKTSQEPSGELISAIESLLEWVPKSGKGSSGYLRVERVKTALKAGNGPQEPRCPKCGCGAKKNERKPILLPTLKNQVICYACEISFPIERLSDFAQFFSPAQSQGAAPETTKTMCSASMGIETVLNIGQLCYVCGTLMVPTGLTRPEMPKFQCLSCGATTSCTEGAAETSDIANIVNWRKESE